MMECPQTSKQEYLDTFFALLGKEKTDLVLNRARSQHLQQTVAFYYTVEYQRQVKFEDIALTAVEARVPLDAVIVVENINLDWIANLGTLFQVDSSFFANYAICPSGDTPWKAIFGDWPANHKKPIQIESQSQDSALKSDGSIKAQNSWHVDGVFEYDQYLSSLEGQSRSGHSNLFSRSLSYDKKYGWSASTRISYVRVNDHLYLFLVDAPMRQSSAGSANSSLQRSQLRLPLGLNRGGLVLPQLFDRSDLSLLESFNNFFSHPWHFHVLFARKLAGAVHYAPETIFHLLSSSTWLTNLEMVERHIKRIGFVEIRRPSISTNDKLHDQRHDLAYMLSHVITTLKWIPPSVKEELETVQDYLPATKYIGYPDVILREIVESAENLEKFLINTFNLLLSSISVMEAKSSKAQARRGQMLTQLAFAYAPLSFVTGIFGMNVREINGSRLSAWVSVVTLLIVGAGTFSIFAAFRWRQKYWSKGKEM